MRETHARLGNEMFGGRQELHLRLLVVFVTTTLFTSAAAIPVHASPPSFQLIHPGLYLDQAAQSANHDPVPCPVTDPCVTPQVLWQAYQLYPAASTYGADRTVAVIEPTGAYQQAQSDMNQYRRRFNLAPCLAGCFTQLWLDNQDNPTHCIANAVSNCITPTTSPQETSLDLEMVSATCPKCKLLLIETPPVGRGHWDSLTAALDDAGSMGATVVSMSFSCLPNDCEPNAFARLEPHLEHKGVLYVAASSDAGFTGSFGLFEPSAWPADSNHVLAVGGTDLDSISPLQQHVWSPDADNGGASGSGCSTWASMPEWQARDSNITSVCSKKATADVSLVATDILMYVSNDVSTGDQQSQATDNWKVVAGTSASAPAVAGIAALAQSASGLSHPAAPYVQRRYVQDVTSGSNYDPNVAGAHKCFDSNARLCNAVPGWDGPTGLGTPVGIQSLEVFPLSAQEHVDPQPGGTIFFGGNGVGGLAEGTFAIQYPYRFHWDFGDGTAATTPSGVHAYTRNGTYTVTMTVTDWADQVATTQKTVTITAVHGPASIRLALNPSTIAANGRSTSTATATVTDAGGSGMAGRTVTMSTSGDATIGSVTDNGNGTYTATITASTTAGPETITAGDSAAGLSAQQTLTETAAIIWTAVPTATLSGAVPELNAVSCTAANACLAVGYDYSTAPATHRTLAERWDGNSWTITPTIDPGGSTGLNELTGVSCTAANSCIAVGYFNTISGVPGNSGNMTLAERWDGTSWSLATPPNPSVASNAVLLGVSCSAADACIAVGWYSPVLGDQRTLAERWNGTTWTLQSTPNTFTSTNRGELLAVSCTAPNACTAVGTIFISPGTTLAERWDGTSWTVQIAATPVVGVSYLQIILNGVSCSAASACTAVGYYLQQGSNCCTQTLAEEWNGVFWSIVATGPSVNPAGTSNLTLTAVSCTAPDSCTAVGSKGASGDGYFDLAEQWDGSSWTVNLYENYAFGRGLTSVSCVAANTCMAVGFDSPAVRGT